MIGRVEELRWVREAIAQPMARVQLLGPAGVGKSTLARAAVEGERWFSLEPVAAGGLRRHLASGLDTLVNADALRAAVQGLEVLVLDGAETHREEIGELLAQWEGLTTRILITSQSRHAGAQTLEVGTLPHDEAVAMFLEISKRQTGRADLEDPEVDALVRSLDGWPLAIELAASRLRLYSPLEMLEEDVLEVLQDGQRPGRHGSLDRALRASWNQLTEEEQLALSQIALVCGYFDRVSFKGITEASLPVLERLMDASLVVWESHRGRRRYRLLGVIRAFGLRELDPVDPARERYARWALSAADEAVARVRGEHSRAAYDTLGRLAPDLESLLSAGPVHAASAGIALAVFAYNQGSVERALGHVQGLDRARVPVALGEELVDLEANLLIRCGQLAVARDMLESLPETVHRLNLRGQCFRDSDPEQSLALFERAAVLVVDPAPYDAVITALSRGIAHRRLGFLERSERAAMLALEISREHGLVTTEVAALANLALVGRDLRGATPDLERTISRTLALSESQGIMRRVCQLRLLRAQFLLDMGREQALSELELAEVAARRIGMGPVLQMVQFLRGLDALERQDVTALQGILVDSGEVPGVLGLQQVWLLRAHEAWALGELDAAGTWFERVRVDAVKRELHQPAAMVAVELALLGGVAPAVVPERWPESSPLRCLWQIADHAYRGVRLPEVWIERASRSIRCRLLLRHGVKGVEVAADGSWFVGSEGHVDLGRRRVMRRLLTVLASHVGEPVELEALLEGGWPGEKMGLQSGRARVHVAVSELRRMGLRDALLTAESDGVAYALVATVRR